MSNSGVETTAGTGVEPGSLGDQAARVFEFLVEMQRLRTKIVRDLAAYRSVLWFSDLPESPQVTSPMTGGDSTPWLAVERVERTRPPAPPEGLEEWISDEQLRASNQAAPALSPRILRPVEVLDDVGEPQVISEEVLLADHPEVEQALLAWLPTWSVWAAEDLRRRAIAERYQQLYEIHQATRASAETYELLLCFGLLRMTSGGQPVRRHLLVVPATIELDLVSGRLSVEPSPDDAELRLEQDMLDPADTVPESVRLSVREALAAVSDPWSLEPGGPTDVLRTWVNGLSAEATFDSGTDPNMRRSAGPAVRYAPALVLRERTRRSFIAAGEQIVAALRAGTPVPSGVRKFVQVGGGSPSETAQKQWTKAYSDGEVYFPKPANEEQRQIVERLAYASTLVVQGPPGTGKTHTIANLITDMLAHGQRVLITSTTTRALRVLKEQLPSEIADLCVSVTDDAVRGQADLERSVNRILQKHHGWNRATADGEAAGMRQRLVSARTRGAGARQELLSIREHETYRYSRDVGDYEGTLAEIATRLAEEEERLGWLGPVTDGPSPIDGHDAVRFFRLLTRATPAVRGRAGRLMDDAQLVAADAFEDLCDRRADLSARSAALDEARRSSAYSVLSDCEGEIRARVRQSLRELVRLRHVLQRSPGNWVPTAVVEVLAGRDRTWRAQLETSTQALSLVEQHLPAVDGRTVTGLDELDLEVAYRHASDLAQHLTGGGKLRGVFGSTRPAKAAADFLDRVRVDGQRCEEHRTLQPAWTQVVIERALQPQERLFGVSVTTGVPVRQRVGRLHDEVEVLTDVVALAEAVEGLRHGLRGVGLADVDARDERELEALTQVLDAVDAERLRHDVEVQVRPSERSLAAVADRRDAAASVAVALRALQTWDAPAYRAARASLDAAADANALLSELDVSRKLVTGAAPGLVRRIEGNPTDEAWLERLPALAQAWAWSVWDARVAARTASTAEEDARRAMTTAEFDQAKALRELAGNRGWAHCMERLTDEEATHLNLYSLNIRKVGKGTGKYAERYRREARASLRRSQSAVPAWIMPMHQVFETVPVDSPDLFDVVIVDEASQSGLEGLLLSWLAPRIVVVGDDKQVSPSNIGLNHEQVFTLQDRYLSDLSTRSLFGPQSSLFDQAVGMARSRLMLKEHFRCMPEIIGFSDELCYDGQLLPLRQFGADRLPPLRTTYVRGAMVSGTSSPVNEAEAEALVEQLVKCSVNPAYDKKTFGVITLLGDAQDGLLTEKLLEALGVQEAEARRLRVSNPEGFQGDERDVIFISMVSSLQSPSGPARIGTLSKESDQQRLNVAASRARDQVWLFHSVQPGDLSTKDLRRRYLEHLLRPMPDQGVLDLGPVLPDVRHDKFDSLFEQRVYLQIRARGFRVRPQVKAGRYRIDLVVEGGSQRLAVECDGDAFHGLEEVGDDMGRQRDLERVGWTFWRIRQSTFNRDPRRAMEPLWGLLAELGIEPPTASPGASDIHDVVVARATAPSDDVPVAVVPDDGAMQAAAEGPQLGSASMTRPPHVQPSARAKPLPKQAPRLPVAMPTPRTPHQGGEGEVARQRPARPRLRGGKVLMTAAARARVEKEIASIEAWLSAPPPLIAVDERSRRVQQSDRTAHSELLEERLDQLKRVLQQSVVDPSAGGQWVTHGSLVTLRIGSREPGDVIVCSFDDSEHERISPFIELGRMLEGAELGATLVYQGPTRQLSATVTKIHD